jgi:hypothetical protein
MFEIRQQLTIFVAAAALTFPLPAATKSPRELKRDRAEITSSGSDVLWRNPVDISSRNLYYGPGGKKHEPQTSFTFVKEDLDGTNPKYIVTDSNGVKWKIKLGQEAKPETVASRLVWAVGYEANEDYYVPMLQVQGLPRRLHRGAKLIEPGGVMHDARLKRYLKDEKKIGVWKWRDDPFTGTREYNGLRVMMALINNWDLKDENNAVYSEKNQRIYLVSDLGASFGSTGLSWTQALSKGNLRVYSRSRFIDKVTAEYVDFHMPTRPALIRIFGPPEFFRRVELRWIGKRIPREDAKWMGELLARLSPQQIHDAFRAAGYSPDQVEGFSTTVQSRIAELNRL